MSIPLDHVRFNKHVLTLTDCQAAFARCVLAWCKVPCKQLVIVSGGPGTGKSFVVTQTLDHVLVPQCRMSYTARSAGAIGGRTIHSTLHLDYRGLCQDLEQELQNEQDLVASIKASRGILNELTYDEDPLVVVVDEVSMINGWLMYWLIRFFMDRTCQPLLFIALGDPHQLNPVKYPHNLFAFDFSGKRWPVHRIHLTENKRFTPEYGRMVDALRRFVDEDNESGLFAYVCENYPVGEIEGTLLARADRAMAAKNDRVDTFNAYYLKQMVKGPEVQVHDRLVLKPGCLVMVTQNGYASSSAVTNGTELVFVRLCKYMDRLVCQYPRTQEEVTVRRNASYQFPVTLGFAATIHKFQGDTIDRAKVVIHLDGNRNLNLAYTALSRVRHLGQILAVTL